MFCFAETFQEIHLFSNVFTKRGLSSLKSVVVSFKIYVSEWLL